MSVRDLSLKFPTSKLIEILSANRAQHAKDFDEAVVAWKAKVRAICALKIDAIDAGKKISNVIDAVVPEKHLEDYDQALDMLKLTSEAEVSLTGDQFRSLVLDKWVWSHSYASNTLSYKS